MLKLSTFIFLIVIALLGLGSCVQEPSFPATPVIKFNSIRKIVKTSSDGLGGKIKIDSVIMSVDFQDGDGDLGLTVAQIKADPKYKDFSNFMVDVFIQKNGKFVPITFSPRLGGLVNFPFLPNQKPGPIEGTIDYSTPFVYAFYKGYSPLFTEKNDTLKFQIKIVDNAFNVSNTIETAPIIIFQD
ncbi:hypothetical protein V7S76_10500 [Aquirufa sp. ROCK2-A2]